MSAASKWTPGQWYVTEDEQDERVSIASVVPSDVSLVAAHVHPCDAPLLRAAPGLYAALEEAEATLPMLVCKCSGGFICSRCKALASADAALRAARGEP